MIWHPCGLRTWLPLAPSQPCTCLLLCTNLRTQPAQPFCSTTSRQALTPIVLSNPREPIQTPLGTTSSRRGDPRGRFCRALFRHGNSQTLFSSDRFQTRYGFERETGTQGKQEVSEAHEYSEREPAYLDNRGCLPKLRNGGVSIYSTIYQAARQYILHFCQ